MTFASDIADDFVDVVDGLATVTVKDRRGIGFSLANVLRRAISTREAAKSNGRYTTNDTAFHAAVSADSSKIALGWKIVDGDATWTVIEAAKQTLSNRYRFVCRNLSLVHDLTQRVHLQLATWTKNTSGVLEPTWETVEHKIPCRVTFQSSENDVEHSLRNHPRQADIVLELAQTLGESHRFIMTEPDCYVFNIVSIENVEAIDALMTVKCEVVPWPLS